MYVDNVPNFFIEIIPSLVLLTFLQNKLVSQAEPISPRIAKKHFNSIFQDFPTIYNAAAVRPLRNTQIMHLTMTQTLE